MHGDIYIYIYIYIYVIRTNKMHTFYINDFNSIILSSTCFEQASVHPQEDLYVKFYGICSCVHISSLVNVRMGTGGFLPGGKAPGASCH